MLPRDPRAPVIVGGGQLTVNDASVPVSPLAMMAESARHAISDAGGAGLTERIDSIGVVESLSWRTGDPAAALAGELGARPRETVGTRTSGTSPFELLADACQRIADGHTEVALLAGGEAVRALRAGRYDGGPELPAAEPTRVLGTDATPVHPGETAARLTKPVRFYPLFEHALRAEAGRDPQTHDKWLGRLWARFAEVARNNPYATVRGAPDGSPITADYLTETGETNRMIAHPYRKLMTANVYTDQAAALLVCSAAAAEAAGIPRDRWVFVHGTAAANDHWFVGERAELHRSPAIRAMGAALLGHLGVGIDEVEHIDLYSCFPSAVQVAAAELGIDLADEARTPTLTGGLSFAGGPVSNYGMHALASALPRLRDDTDGTALCTGVGWYLTKHASAALAARPPERPYTHLNPQSEVDSLPRRQIAEQYSGEATVETYTISYDRAGAPEKAHISCVLSDGSRAFATAPAPVATALSEMDPVGARVRLSETATFELSG